MKKGLLIGGGIAAGAAVAFFIFTNKSSAATTSEDTNPRLVPTGVTGVARGERNNNPCNLTPLDNGQKWDGQVGIDTDGDTPYLIFDSPIKGIRAAGIQALNYYTVHQLTTLRAIGDRWGPKSSDHYGEDLAQTIGVDADATFIVPANLESLLKAIAINEESEVPYTEADWSQGVSLALAAKGYG